MDNSIDITLHEDNDINENLKSIRQLVSLVFWNDNLKTSREFLLKVFKCLKLKGFNDCIRYISQDEKDEFNIQEILQEYRIVVYEDPHEVFRSIGTELEPLIHTIVIFDGNSNSIKEGPNNLPFFSSNVPFNTIVSLINNTYCLKLSEQNASDTSAEIVANLVAEFLSGQSCGSVFKYIYNGLLGNTIMNNQDKKDAQTIVETFSNADNIINRLNERYNEIKNKV